MVDKMLTNYWNVGFLHLVFPNSPIIHIERDPMDQIFSCYKYHLRETRRDAIHSTREYITKARRTLSYITKEGHGTRRTPKYAFP